jgi:UDP-glucose 4-epimerase
MTADGPGAGRLLVVGAGSFIARHFIAACEEPVRAVGHDAIDRPDLLDGIDRVIGCARHPLLGSDDYRPLTMDPDVRLAGRVAGRDIDYVMLSSRKVYAPSAKALAETDRAAPQDLYGRQKLAAERALRARLGARLTVLRLANVFGDERGPARRTFMSQLLDGLAREDRIRFEMSPFTARDFLPVAAC